MRELYKEFIKMGKSYLERNDINGFYKFILETNDRRAANFGSGDYLEPNEISAITAFFINNGINVIDYLDTTVPECCFYESIIPNSMVDDGILMFPKNIVNIGNYAFCGSENYSMVDLRGMNRVGAFAFDNSDVQEIVLDDHVKVDFSAFDNCENLRTVYLPHNSFNKWKETINTKWVLHHQPWFEESFE